MGDLPEPKLQNHTHRDDNTPVYKMVYGTLGKKSGRAVGNSEVSAFVSVFQHLSLCKVFDFSMIKKT